MSFNNVASSLCVSVGAPVWPREIIEPVVISAGLPLVLSCDPPAGPPKPETYWMSSCKWVFKGRDIGNSWRQHASILLQVHTRGLLTGRSRRPSPPCRRCGRTAGCPWVWTETCTSPTSCSTTPPPITAATLAYPTGTSFSRRCPWLSRFSQVGAIMWAFFQGIKRYGFEPVFFLFCFFRIVASVAVWSTSLVLFFFPWLNKNNSTLFLSLTAVQTQKNLH